jgi:hypothetical protein
MTMRTWIWAVVTALGFGLMLGAYGERPRTDPKLPWAQGLIALGPAEAVPKSLPGRSFPARVRILTGDERKEALLNLLRSAVPDEAKSLELQIRPKLIELSLPDAGIGADAVDAGRLPVAGRDEVLAGANALASERLQVGQRTFNVVGVLKPGLAVLAGCYFVPPSPAADSLFPRGDPSVQHATLVGLTREQAQDQKVIKELETAFPTARFEHLMVATRLGRDAYYLYLLGLANLLVGGSGVLIGLYRWGAVIVRPPWLAAPLREIQRRPRLVWIVHLVYFGLVILGALVAYELPELQMFLMRSIRDQIGGKSGPLAAAGRAYMSGSIPRAAAVTFLVNFVLGTVAMITLPSMIVPGAGVIVAAFRGYSWGVVFGPSFVPTAWAMLPHSWTMLLEGEGYILATFFALLIPLSLIAPAPAQVPTDPETEENPDPFAAVPPAPKPNPVSLTVLDRFLRALLLNAQGLVLVALVLVVAALYEATEIILLMR